MLGCLDKSALPNIRCDASKRLRFWLQELLRLTVLSYITHESSAFFLRGMVQWIVFVEGTRKPQTSNLFVLGLFPSLTMVMDRLQTKRSFGDIIGLWRRKSEVVRPTCDRCTDRVRPVYQGRRPLQVTDIHRVVDIVPQMVEDYENPLWLVRRIAQEQSKDPAASQSNCQLSPTCTGYMASERRRTLSLDTKNISRAPEREGTKALFLHPKQHNCSCTSGSKSHKRFLINRMAPLRLRRNQNRSESDVTRLDGGCLIQDERLPYAQSLGKRSNALPLDDALSPLQRMTNKLNEWTTCMVPDDGARLRPGPAAYLPVVRRAKPTVDSPKSAKSPASACPPFPSISHSTFDLRCASQKPGYHRARLHSSPCPYGLGRSRMLPICQKSSTAVGRR